MCVGRVEIHRSLLCSCRLLTLKGKAEISVGCSSTCANDPRSMRGLWLSSRRGEHLLLTRCHCGLLFSFVHLLAEVFSKVFCSKYQSTPVLLVFWNVPEWCLTAWSLLSAKRTCFFFFLTRSIGKQGKNLSVELLVFLSISKFCYLMSCYLTCRFFWLTSV